MKILLHIGRQKTGTTSIQRYLLEKSEILEEAGYYYSREATHKREGHHEYAKLLETSGLKVKGRDSNLKERLDQFGKLFDYLKPDKINIISSEAFQNCDPKVVKMAFEDHEVSVACYIRCELDAVVSSYAQKVHASRYSGSMEDYVLETKLDYYTFLTKWSYVFGSKFTVRAFDKNYLTEGNVLCDFFGNFLHMDAPDDALTFKDSNPSLTNRMLALKLKVNSNGKRINRVYRRLSLLSKLDKDSGKVRMSEELKAKIIGGYILNQKKWAPKFFSESQIFDYESVKTGTDYDMGDAEYGEFMELLSEWADRNPQI
jgi:hypothetical protein